MPFDYLAAFPIPAHVIPSRLRELLEPVGLSPSQFVEVASKQECDPHGEQAEHFHLLMAVVPGLDDGPMEVLSETRGGVVEYSVPVGDERGCSANFCPSISGHDYIVAAWGDGSFYTFNLAEKVWMTLGLTPRCVGNDQQRLVYDDLELPEFGVAEGEVSSEYHWSLKRAVSWRMSNEYLRRYLWLRGARGVRVFYYSVLLPDVPEIRAIMDGEPHVFRKPTDGVAWYELDIREHKGRPLLQLWASVEAVMPELCPEQTAEGIQWPGDTQPMTHARADALVGHDLVYLDDRFLQKYEQSVFYDSAPAFVWEQWYCSPSYRGQWAFTECRRIGRNLIQVPMRELYKPKPDREIVHARSFAVDPSDLAHVDLDEEHVVAKVQRLLDVLLRLGDGLSALGATVGLNKSAVELTGFDRAEVAANGWLAYPALSRLAQVAPLNMTQQMFLARCKGLHEVWQRVPNGYLKSLLERAGCPRVAVKELGSLRLLQALLNVIERLNAHEEASDAFASGREPEGWNDRNEAMAPLFLNNDLRIADAHEAVEQCLTTLQRLGFDTANVNAGYGRALDFVLDGVINALGAVAAAIEKLIRPA
ncbi:hypothetical protein ACOTEO_01120 [Achromobacter xylosoxidans]|uniref:hypothetical protein n=1 Tax=Achromobacter TaxID=222 RepID=UPI000761C3AF|nr:MULTISPECIES: hypothetical protein [Achromobacter]KWU21983.1 hypothetical protein AS148_04810 [Achromobacter xylosoxidans]OFQ48074.1 hypothetical protein HMPREF2939_17465 [Achromobacter xylosoxidans]OFU71959.1 hypothetical protein HMPREF3137_19790 [Achromobacter xylosoxidans]PWY52393.1 hypothetical protein DK459_05545 [Achromobacter sp. RW408]